MKRFRLLTGDCIEVMRRLDDASVDAIVTDPPYGLGFMGKQWDELPPGLEWAEECLRVLKPGGHLLAFGGSRTYHRLAAAVEDAGFEIRDQIMWLYGSGFPKSLDVSKAIDKRGGSVAAFDEFRDAVKAAMKINGVTRKQLQEALGNHMLSHYLTAGSQPAVPNLRDYRIIRDTAGLDGQFDGLFRDEAEREVIGNQTKARSSSGKSALPTVGGETKYETWNLTVPATEQAAQWEGWGTALKPAHEPIVVARKPLIGTVAQNVLKHGTGAININDCRVGVETRTSSNMSSLGVMHDDAWESSPGSKQVQGRWPANVILDKEAGEMLDEQSGQSKSGKGKTVSSPTVLGQMNDDGWQPKPVEFENYGDQGGASRFFYSPKASKKERNAGLENMQYKDGGCLEGNADKKNARKIGAHPDRPVALVKNIHPTVKPVELMRYLCRLVTPPGGVILDPFLGSGSTGCAVAAENNDQNPDWGFIGIEREAEYMDIAKARIKHWRNQKPKLKQLKLETPAES